MDIWAGLTQRRQGAKYRPGPHWEHRVSSGKVLDYVITRWRFGLVLCLVARILYPIVKLKPVCRDWQNLSVSLTKILCVERAESSDIERM